MKRTYRDEIARIILFECSIFESDDEIKANMDHPHVRKAHKAADRIVSLSLDECAAIAEKGCLVPPDGGSPTEAEREMCRGIADRIRSLHDSHSREFCAKR